MLIFNKLEICYIIPDDNVCMIASSYDKQRLGVYGACAFLVVGFFVFSLLIINLSSNIGTMDMAGFGIAIVIGSAFIYHRISGNPILQEAS